MIVNYNNDPRVVMTLDAGGTNFVFGAIESYQEVIPPIHLPSAGNNLELCLANIKNGFHAVRSRLMEKSKIPVAISFAFPGPADYKNGIIGDLCNLTAFKGGVALGSMLEHEFNIPTFINNDGDLYAYGESIAGILPMINEELRKTGSHRQYRNLLGLTLGTGFGGGLVNNGHLYLGDNCSGFEVWLMSQRYNKITNIEENISIRAVKRLYSEHIGVSLDKSPNPKDIYEIGKGTKEGNQQAALYAFDKMGQSLGDALCNLFTISDSIIVIGGGVAGAKDLFITSMLKEINSQYTSPSGNQYSRLTQKIYNLEDSEEFNMFCQNNTKQIPIPGTDLTTTYDSESKLGFTFSKIGTSKAISIGAYAFALNKLDNK